jgi:general secretion pathway protein M
MEEILKRRPSNSRLAAVGLLVAVLAVLYLVVFMPFFSVESEYADTIDDLQFRLQRFRRVAAEKDYWLNRLDEIKRASQQEERFISRDTAALASADLQSMIKDAVTGAGGELISTQVIPERKEEQFTRIAVKVRMTGSTQVLRDVLYGFETRKPVLFIENLNLRPIRIIQPVGPGRKPGRVADKLSVDFDVVGYMRAG